MKDNTVKCISRKHSLRAARRQVDGGEEQEKHLPCSPGARGLPWLSTEAWLESPSVEPWGSLEAPADVWGLEVAAFALAHGPALQQEPLQRRAARWAGRCSLAPPQYAFEAVFSKQL